jgi:hypothetical protein
VRDACRLEKDFWQKRDFNLLQINKTVENPPKQIHYWHQKEEKVAPLPVWNIK